MDSCQIVASLKRRLADAGHAVRNCHARQAIAPRKRRSADTRHAVWNRHARQAVIIVERTIADAGHASSNCNRFDLISEIIPRHITLICPFIHLSCAANRQRTILIQRPGQVIATGATGYDIRRIGIGYIRIVRVCYHIRFLAQRHSGSLAFNLKVFAQLFTVHFTCRIVAAVVQVEYLSCLNGTDSGITFLYADLSA